MIDGLRACQELVVREGAGFAVWCGEPLLSRRWCAVHTRQPLRIWSIADLGLAVEKPYARVCQEDDYVDDPRQGWRVKR